MSEFDKKGLASIVLLITLLLNWCNNNYCWFNNWIYY